NQQSVEIGTDALEVLIMANMDRGGRLAAVIALSMSVFPATPAQDRENKRTRYVFEPQERRVLLDRFPYFWEGYLNANGAFVPDPKTPPIEYKVAAEHVTDWIDAMQKRNTQILNHVFEQISK